MALWQVIGLPLARDVEEGSIAVCSVMMVIHAVWKYQCNHECRKNVEVIETAAVGKGTSRYANTSSSNGSEKRTFLCCT